MITEVGTVVAVEQDGLWVETLKTSACASCAAKSGCGNQLLAKTVGQDFTLVKALFEEQSAQITWNVGDKVQLSLEERALVYAALMAYFLPIVLMITLALAASFISDHVVSSPIGALFGLCLGAFFLRVFSRWHVIQGQFYPKVASKLI